MAIQATSTTVDLEASSAADLTTLQDVRMSDGYRVWVSAAGATHGLWVLDKTSVAGVDNLTVVATFSGVGRWIFFGSGGGGAASGGLAAPTEAGVSAFGVSTLKDGTLATQTTQIATYVLRTDATLVAVPHQILVTTDPTRWWVRQTTPHNLWVTKWTASGLNIATTGNDDTGTGSAGLPLASWSEARRRMGANRYGTPVQITDLATMVVQFEAGDYAESLDMRGIAGAVDILGRETVVASGTINSFTNVNRASGTGWSQVTSAAFVFTTHTKKFLVFTSGAGNITGSRAEIESSPAAGTAQIVPPVFQTQTPAGRRTFGAGQIPAGTETFDIRVPSVSFQDYLGETTTRSQVVAPTPRNVLSATINMVWFSNASPRLTGGVLFVNACKLDTTNLGAASTCVPCGAGSVSFNECILGAASAADSIAAATNACLFVGNAFFAATASGARWTFAQDTLFGDASCLPTNSLCEAVFTSCAWHNTTGGVSCIGQNVSGSKCAGGLTLTSGGFLYGGAAGAATDAIVLGNDCKVFGNGVTPALAFTGAAVRFGSTTRTFAQVAATGFYDLAVGAPAAGENCARWFA